MEVWEGRRRNKERKKTARLTNHAGRLPREKRKKTFERWNSQELKKNYRKQPESPAKSSTGKDGGGGKVKKQQWGWG